MSIPRPSGKFIAWWMLAVLIVLYMLNGMDRHLLSLVVEPVKADLDISDFQMSLLLGFAFSLFYGLCGLPLGWMVDKFPRRYVLYFGVTFWSLATLACGISNTYAQLMMARIALGVGEATLAPAAHSLIADSFPKERVATALSIYTAGGAIGVGGSFIVGGMAVGYFSQFEAIAIPLIGQIAPWQAVFVALGVPGLVLAFLALTFREPPRRHAPTAASGEPHRLLPFLKKRRAVLLAYLGSFAFMTILVFASLSWMPTYMNRAFGWSAKEAGAAIGAINIASVMVGSIGTGLLVDWLLSKGYRDAHLRVLFVTVLIGLPAGIVAFLVSDPTLFLALAFWLKVTSFSFFGYSAAAIQIISPQALRGRMAAVYTLAIFLVGAAIGPSLTAFFTDFVYQDQQKLGWSIATIFAIFMPIILAAAALGMKPMREAVELQREEDAPKAPAV